MQREHEFGFSYFLAVVRTFFISFPLAQLCKTIAGNPLGLAEMGRDSVWILALLLLWRAWDSQLPSL